jgi:type VI secretion system protein ImpG
MLEELLPYYERELGQLHELAGEFAQRYPKIARRLLIDGDQCEDPHVERLIESFAFIAARIHRKLDDEYPEIAESFLQVLYPHYTRPIPACTVLQFETEAAKPEIGGKYVVERHHPVLTPLVQGVQCKFRTCYETALWPLTVHSTQLELTQGSDFLRRMAPDAAAVLTLNLECQGNLTLGQIGLDKLRFYLDGTPQLMHLLYELLCAKTLRIRVGDGSHDPATTLELPAAAIQPVGFAEDEGLLDYDERSFLGYRLLSEYFAFAEKFMFVDLNGLDAPVLNRLGQRLQIQFILSEFRDTERHARLAQTLSPANFKLGCTPAVNLFRQPGEPIRVTHQKASYPVYADSRKQHGYEVIAIEQILRVEKAGGEENAHTVPPFYSVCHGAAQQDDKFFWYATRERSIRAQDKGTDLELQLVELDFTPARADSEVLSLALSCSNRDLPEQLPFGGSASATSADFTLPSHSVVKRTRPLRKPSASLRPPSKGGLQWRLISHLSLNYLSIVDGGKQALQEMLTLYNFSDAQALTRQIQGIVSIDSQPAVTRVASRDFAGFVRGTEITLRLDEEFYVGAGLYLFASVLERFFALYCTPNSFIRLQVLGRHQSEPIASWPARAGEAIVL